MHSFREQLIDEYRNTNRINTTLENIKSAIHEHKGTPGFAQNEAIWLLENWESLLYITKERNSCARDFFVAVYLNQPDIALYELKNTFKMSGAVVKWKRFFVNTGLIIETKPKFGYPKKKYLQINKTLKGISDVLIEIISSESKDSYFRKLKR